MVKVRSLVLNHLRESELLQLGVLQSEALRDFRLQNMLRYHAEVFPKAKNCMTPDCVNRIVPQECGPDRHYDCKACKRSYCFECGDGHRGMGCEAYQKGKKGDEAMMAMISKGLVRKCFNCSALLQKSEGCNRVFCTRCKRNNLWDPNSNLMKEWKDYDHHNRTGETWKGVRSNLN